MYLKKWLQYIILIRKMNNELDSYDKEVAVTLLSNGSANLFKENSLTLFSNKLHTPIILNPSNYHYVALQEIA